MKKCRLSHKDIESTLDDMDRSIDALKAFSTMLDVILFHDGGCLQSGDSGVSALINRHILALEEGLSCLAARERDARTHHSS